MAKLDDIVDKFAALREEIRALRVDNIMLEAANTDLAKQLAAAGAAHDAKVDALSIMVDEEVALMAAAKGLPALPDAPAELYQPGLGPAILAPGA